MARRKCIHCGGDVRDTGYCRSCGLNQSFLHKAQNTSLYYYNTALDRARFHDLTGAVEALRMSLRYNKRQIEARNLLGLVYYEMGETVSAMSQWVISVNYMPKDNPAIRYLKELRDDPRELEKMNRIARGFNKALELAEEREFDQAMVKLRKCIKEDKNFVKAYLLMALISLEQNRKGPARKYISRVIAIDRTNPLALHYLREMGESEENISRLAEEGAENAEELADYYGMEEADEDARPARKIHPERKTGRRTTGVRDLKEQNLARFSNIYMLTGILIGACVFYFLVVPGIRREMSAEKTKSEASYSRTIATQDSEISYLEQSIEAVQGQLDESEKTIEDKDKEISTLQDEVKMLRESLTKVQTTPEGQKQNGETPEGQTPDGETPEGQTPEGQTPEGASTEANSQEVTTETADPQNQTDGDGSYKPTEKNASAQKNNENMNGASGEDIEGMIADE